MGKALYRSYRSKSFDEVVGQEHITETLKNSLKNKTYSHAYLLTGPRGVGKTSVARILAHEVNGAKYPSDEAYVDIIEIDAASNRRIDEIRELRERVAVAPTRLKYKVYIIDEVHMLTREAFNALLKTLEEPPEHAIFILATTDVHKVPDTIISRCIQFHFRLIPSPKIVAHLKKIAKQEKIGIEESALELLAGHSSGSFRDAIALLDQMRGFKSDIKRTDAEKLLGLSDAETIDKLLEHIAAGQIKPLVELIADIREAGVSENRLANQLALKLRDSLSTNPETLQQSIQLAEEVLLSNSRKDPWLSLEISLLKAAAMNAKQSNVVPKQDYQPEAPEKPEHHEAKSKKNKKVYDDSPGKSKPIEPSANILEADLWETILSQLKEINRSLYAVARMAKPEITEKQIVLNFSFDFHYKQMKLAKNNQILLEIVQKLKPEIEEIQYKNNPGDTKVKKEQAPSIKNINNIFGASEVLES